MARNPFQQLYVGERVKPGEFIEIFSDVLVQHAMPLFHPGNVVLSGVQGSGKSMLFKLFEPDVRIAYASKKIDFPVPEDNNKFIGATININRSRCNEFGNRRIEEGNSARELMFGDFFNYVVSREIIESVHTLNKIESISDEFGLRLEDNSPEFIRMVKSNAVWNGYLDDVKDIEDIKTKMLSREIKYRKYLNGNDKTLDPEVSDTNTSVGEPMKVLVRSLKDSGVVPSEIEFYVVVDQYEELATIKSTGGKADYRSVVNKVISRDPTLSYRIGTRGYAWRNHLKVMGSEASLEEDRDYKLVNIDTKLKGQESAKTNIYPEFAKNVFERRLNYTTRKESSGSGNPTMLGVLGRSASPKEQALSLGGASPTKVLRIEGDWPEHVIQDLYELAEFDPLSAKLGEVWYRQKGTGENSVGRPWEKKEKQYWRKERTELALLEIAGMRKQRAIYSGEKDIIGLSGRNILTLLSICQFIWDYASQAASNNDGLPDFPFPAEIQTIGVLQAARTWLDRISIEHGRGNDRYKFINFLGQKFSKDLRSDMKMSNPGHNGISLSIDDLSNNENSEILQFLIEAVDFGNLMMVEHATRNTDRKRRYKFYLNTLYCPIYRIPYQHTKEPKYINADVLWDWLLELDILENRPPRKSPKKAPTSSSTSLPLFDDPGQRLD